MIGKCAYSGNSLVVDSPSTSYTSMTHAITTHAITTHTITTHTINI